MSSVNLLPWREERRERQQREYKAILVFTVLLAGFVGYLVNDQVTASRDYQKQRNQFLTQQIRALDQQIIEVSEVRETRNQLIDRLTLIRDLQDNRPAIVYIFDEIVRATPEDLYLTEIRAKEDKISLRGRAKVNRRVAELMKNCDDSKWFTDPELVMVETTRRMNRFEIVLSLTNDGASVANGRRG